jgi:hypothetical protein
MNRPACVIDVETTGLCPFMGYGMVQFAMIAFDLADPDLKVQWSLDIKINPDTLEDLQVSQEALKFSGKVYEQAKETGFDASAAAIKIWEALCSVAPFKMIPFGQNTTFDLNFTRCHLMKYLPIDYLIDGGYNPYVSTMRNYETAIVAAKNSPWSPQAELLTNWDFLPWSRRYYDLQSMAIGIWHSDPSMTSFSLNSISKKLKIIVDDRPDDHDALHDCKLTLANLRQLKKAKIIA